MMSAEGHAPTDADRLAKLWDAYRQQEDDLREAANRIERLTRDLEGQGHQVRDREQAILDKEAEIGRLHDVIAQKDARIERLQAIEQDLAALQAYKDRIAELEAALAKEKERLAKLFLLYEEAVRSAGGAPA